MQDDEELYKKLMSMIDGNKTLTLKNPKGKTIKISFDVSEQIDHNNSISFQNQQNLCISSQSSVKFIAPNINQKREVQQIEENDFKIPFIKMQSQKIIQIESLQTNLQMKKNHSVLLQNGQKINSLNLEELLIKTDQIKPIKKIQLGSKNKNNNNRPANQAVLNFIQTRRSIQQVNKTVQSSQAKRQGTNKNNESTNHMSSQTLKPATTPSKRHSTNSKTVNQSIELLKQLHPEDKQHLQIISQRMMQLQKVQKDKMKLDQQISSIFSASLNNSLKLDSFDVSMLSSLKLNINSDPLCQIFSQYIRRNQSTHSITKNTAASFLFLYSQPMLDIYNRQIDQQINYFQQQQIIQKILRQIKCKVQYIRQRATLDKFHYWMKQSVQIMHFCGHGVQEKENYLLFENNVGKSVKMDYQMIANMFKQFKTELKLVFVASCHSQSTGKVFYQAGVSHVLCIKDDHIILDQICQQFVKIFYKVCIHDRMKICEAFKFTKKQLQLMGKFSSHQIQKFVMINSHNQKQKQCTQLEILQQGQFRDLTRKPYYDRILPSRVENFIPRPKDLYEILKLIDSKKRFITITGMSGIGKSTLVRELVRYIQFRNFFMDGVVYVDVRGCENIDKIIDILDLQLFQTNTLKHNRSLQENIQKIVKELNKRHILIVMDNCHHIMVSDDKQGFKKMIQSIMKNCDDTYFVFTHRSSISRQIDYCSQKLYELGKMNQKQSSSLFFQTIPRNVNKKQLQQFFQIQKNVRQVPKHPFFQFLNGHPQAICMTASLLSQRSLPQLYQLLLKPFQQISNQLGIQQKKLSNQVTNKVVQTAMKISLNVLKNKHKGASQIIKVLSMLPRGMDAQMLSRIVGRNYRQSLKKLSDHSLVKIYQRGQTKYYAVNPNIIVDIQNQINTDEKLKYHQKICEQYMKRCERIYRNVGTLSQKSQKYQEMFLNEEDNYKTIILRQLSFYGEKFQLKRFYSDLFQGEYYVSSSSSLQYDQENFHSPKLLIDLKNAYIINETNRKIKYNQKMKQATKKQSLMFLVVYYVTNLFVIKKANFCQKYIQYGVFLASKKKLDIIAANLYRLKACIELGKNKILSARQYFQIAWQLYALQGCGLGSASCEAGVGYIKYLQQQYAMSKMNLQNALKYYDQIPHAFGKHYLNRWLCSLKSKMNRTQNQLINHKKQAQKLLKQAKVSLKSSNINNTSTIKHKLGVFVFRFLFDNMSLFLEASFQTDVKPKLINTVTKKNQKPINILDKQIVIVQKQEKNNKEQKVQKITQKIQKIQKQQKQQKVEKYIKQEKKQQKNYQSSIIARSVDKKVHKQQIQNMNHNHSNIGVFGFTQQKQQITNSSKNQIARKFLKRKKYENKKQQTMNLF